MAGNLHDVIIIGGGAAGLTAAIYTRRKQLTTVVVSPETGGATALSNWVENYPGANAMAGLELMGQFAAQVAALGTPIVAAKVTAIQPGRPFQVTLDDGKILASRAVIITAGKVPRRLKVPGENRFFGRGVSTCATCDGPLFKGKPIAIVGGGNAAVEAALDLVGLAQTVYLIHRRQTFRADEITVAKLKQSAVRLVPNSQVTAVVGERFVSGVMVRDQAGATATLAVNGVFLEIGSDTDPVLVAPFAKNSLNEIVVDDRRRTDVPGAFAAGDVTNVAYKQTVIAAGDGAIAALEAHRFLTVPGYAWPKR